MGNEIQMHDITLIATLSLMGFNYSRIEYDRINSKRMLFFYSESMELQKAIEDFEAGKVRIEPRRFSNELRHFRAIMTKRNQYDASFTERY